MRRQRIRDKRDRVRQLRIFCEVVRAGTFSGAAEHLGLTQPTVSIQIRELEHEFGAVLFARNSTGAATTPAGDRLHVLAAPLVRGVDAVFDDPLHSIDGTYGGRVRVAASTVGASFILPRFVRRFRDRCPDIVVRLQTIESLREGLDRLREERTDLACGVREDSYPENIFRYSEISTYGIVLVTPLDHSLATRERVSPSEVNAFRAIVPTESIYSRQFSESAAREFGLDFDRAVEVGDWSVVKRYVEAGLGISLIPSLCLSEYDRLSVVALDAHFPARSYGVFTRRDRLLTPAAGRFLDVLVPNSTPPGADDARRRRKE